jgi:choice-of-anchor A domain-containing protein
VRKNRLFYGIIFAVFPIEIVFIQIITKRLIVNKVKVYVSIIAGLTLFGSASAGFVDITKGFNLISFGDATLKSSDVEGRVAAGGLNNYIDAYSIGLKATESADLPYSLISKGNVTYNNGSIYNGGVYAGGDAIINGVNPIEGAVIENGASGLSSVFDFNEVRSDLLTLSSVYTSAAQNGIVTNQYGSLTLTGTSDVNYFTINASDIRSGWANNLNFNLLNSNAISVINIIGDIAATEFNLNMSGNKASNTLLNFTGTDEFTLLGSVNSSILAANMDINFSYGNIDGQVVANKVTAGSQFNFVAFNDPPTHDVPEASTISLLLVGGLCLLLVSKRKFVFRK